MLSPMVSLTLLPDGQAFPRARQSQTFSAACAPWGLTLPSSGVHTPLRGSWHAAHVKRQISMNTTFAVVTAEDVEAFAELYALVYNAAPWHDGWSVPLAKERLRGLAAAPRLEALAACERCSWHRVFKGVA